MANLTPSAFAFDWDAEVSDDVRDKLFDKIVWAVRRWRLEVPSALFLEINAPMSRLAGQGMIVFSPFLSMFFPGGVYDVQICSKILEEPNNVRNLIDRISDLEDKGAK